MMQLPLLRCMAGVTQGCGRVRSGALIVQLRLLRGMWEVT